ncbi:MAG: phosphotriesterase-related protein [Acidimicrobiia bacterium]
MTTVETARGPVSTDALGSVLMHEHVFVLSHEFHVNYPDVVGFDEDHEVDAAVARMNELVDAGVGTIVDLTVVGLGRDIRLLARVAERTDLNIVVATGYYTFGDLANFVELRARVGRVHEADLLAEWFVGDITEGIARSGIKAGILKCATDAPGVTSGVEATLRAVARAHLQTGVPISTHTHPATRRGLEQQDVFEQEGVDLSRVIIGHSGDTADLEYLEALLTRGSYLGMDRFGLYGILSKEARVETIATLCSRGYADRMVLSHDASCVNDWFPSGVMGNQADWHYCHISRDVLPLLTAAGVSDTDLTTMLVDNPRRIFEQSAKY